ncbi:hypothetical protein QR680_002524 [Steinernema hermaphroditum]|uniref:Uncharacterized protein n=1 Tax=Steinernema hermaphroditum TaxID=289476 RepID=A0AA39H311_9BILA|nr:hypothetical protein QR680_002524 [Steinernema hermaphroditum]
MNPSWLQWQHQKGEGEQKQGRVSEFGGCPVAAVSDAHADPLDCTAFVYDSELHVSLQGPHVLAMEVPKIGATVTAGTHPELSGTDVHAYRHASVLIPITGYRFHFALRADQTGGHPESVQLSGVRGSHTAHALEGVGADRQKRRQKEKSRHSGQHGTLAAPSRRHRSKAGQGAGHIVLKSRRAIGMFCNRLATLSSVLFTGRSLRGG